MDRVVRCMTKSWKFCGVMNLKKFYSSTNVEGIPIHLEEVGKFDLPKQIGRYPAGQCFLHKTFAYRGVILFPWKAQLIDRDYKKELPKVVTYYQVLMDERDLPYVKAQTEMNNFAVRGPGKWMFSIPGLDHVPHDDIIPYKPTAAKPVSHSSFDRYFTVRPLRGRRYKKVIPKLHLHEWRRKHISWLYQTQVHRMTTEKVRITAVAFYMGRRRLSHWWKYCVRLENMGDDTILLQGQRWGIYIGNGELKTVKGMGILGQLLALTKSSPAVQFSSQVSLLAPRGHMWGYYLIQRHPGGRTFLCPVPSFALESTLARDPLRTITK